MAKLRLFIAWELPEDMRAELARAQEQIRGGLTTQPKWVGPDSMHLTLKFLGGVEEEAVDVIKAALERAAEEKTTLNVRLGQAGTFGGRRPRVVWVGLQGELEKLAQLQEAIEAELLPIGFAAEQRPYQPHLTLARVPADLSRADSDNLKAAVAAVRPRPVKARFSEVALIRSTLTRSGAVYERMSAARLRP